MTAQVLKSTRRRAPSHVLACLRDAVLLVGLCKVLVAKGRFDVWDDMIK